MRTITRIGDTVWVGGQFRNVKEPSGSLLGRVTNLVAFDVTTGRYKDLAPAVGGDASEVWDVEPYGDDLVIAGSFTDPEGAGKNLVMVDGTTGRVIRWYDAEPLTSVLAVPDMERIYGGGKDLSAFEVGGRELWTRARTAVDPTLRPLAKAPGYRDLERDGQTIWAACICDSVGGHKAKALVKLDLSGGHDASWNAEAEPEAFGISLAQRGGMLYLGAGGNDFLAQYSKADGDRRWVRDTSGSVQAVEITTDRLVAGGHFWEVADQSDDRCGHRSADNPDELDPKGECETRHGLAAYSFHGELDLDWNPKVSGRYSLVWALLPIGNETLLGGEFTEVEDEPQSFYGRLQSPDP